MVPKPGAEIVDRQHRFDEDQGRNEMNIGQAAKASGVNAKMMRYYEAIKLIPPAARSDAGYRSYSDTDINRIRFVGRARDLGFSVEQIRNLLALWHDKDRSSADVKALALQHIATLNEKIDELKTIVHTLEHLAQTCHGDTRPDCPILENLGATHSSAHADAESRERKPSLSPIVGKRAKNGSTTINTKHEL